MARSYIQDTVKLVRLLETHESLEFEQRLPI
jgi:hypothetical protein